MAHQHHVPLHLRHVLGISIIPAAVDEPLGRQNASHQAFLLDLLHLCKLPRADFSLDFKTSPPEDEGAAIPRRAGHGAALRRRREPGAAVRARQQQQQTSLPVPRRATPPWRQLRRRIQHRLPLPRLPGLHLRGSPRPPPRLP